MTPPDVNDAPAEPAADAADVVLEVAGLRAAYGHVPVLHGITFALHAGDVENDIGATGRRRSAVGANVRVVVSTPFVRGAHFARLPM